jgi:hypothetical protein
MKTFPYPFEEFELHFADYGTVRKYEHIETDGVQMEVGDEQCLELGLLRVMDYMKQKYSNEEEAQEKGIMFLMIQMYLAHHAEAFNHGRHAVLGSESGLISRNLLRAVHHFYTSQTLKKIGHGPTPKKVIALAKTYAEE